MHDRSVARLTSEIEVETPAGRNAQPDSQQPHRQRIVARLRLA
jgi:hypothetical protein